MNTGGRDDIPPRLPRLSLELAQMLQWDSLYIKRSEQEVRKYGEYLGADLVYMHGQSSCRLNDQPHESSTLR
jgi:hypothetical protein